jgi:hypothetical protein
LLDKYFYKIRNYKMSRFGELIGKDAPKAVAPAPAAPTAPKPAPKPAVEPAPLKSVAPKRSLRSSQ